MDFIYNYSKPEYETIIAKHLNIKKQYLYEKQILFEEYQDILLQFDNDKYQQLLLKKKKLDIKYILKIIAIFKPLLKHNTCIFLHGSYARNLNRWYSDIDLNILYSNTLKSRYLVVEEFVQALIYQMMDFKGRDKIHNIMLYYPLSDDKNYKIKSNKHKIICQNNSFSFCCRPNYRHIYPLILNASRDPRDLYNWLLERKDNDENQYSFQGLNIRGKYFIYKLLRKKTSQQKFIDLKELINKTLENINRGSSLERYMSIANLNKIVKINNFHIINNFLLCLKEYISLKKGRCYYLDFYKIGHNKIILREFKQDEWKKLDYLITKYRFVIDRLEHLLGILGVNFSSREKQKIDIHDIDEYYKKEFHITFMDDYQIIFDVFEMINKFLIQIGSKIS